MSHISAVAKFSHVFPGVLGEHVNVSPFDRALSSDQWPSIELVWWMDSLARRESGLSPPSSDPNDSDDAEKEDRDTHHQNNQPGGRQNDHMVRDMQFHVPKASLESAVELKTTLGGRSSLAFAKSQACRAWH